MKWISVKDSVPEIDEVVFIAYKNVDSDGNFHPAYLSGYLNEIIPINEYIKLYDWLSVYDTPIQTPDYWAPIVPLPEGE